jgi:hypothetical protein
MSDKWEHKIAISPDTRQGEVALQNFLDDFGNSGWEAVSMVPSRGGWFIIILFKRKISS